MIAVVANLKALDLTVGSDRRHNNDSVEEILKELRSLSMLVAEAVRLEHKVGILETRVDEHERVLASMPPRPAE